MRHYMQTLRERGEILDVHRKVDPKHELAAVTQAAVRRWNKPILFHRVAGTTLPVADDAAYGRRCPRLCENMHARRTRSIVFSIVFPP